MGYDVHITRKAESWGHGQDSAAISLAEWQAYVATDPELCLDHRAAEPIGGTNASLGVEDAGHSPGAGG